MNWGDRRTARAAYSTYLQLVDHVADIDVDHSLAGRLHALDDRVDGTLVGIEILDASKIFTREVPDLCARARRRPRQIILRVSPDGGHVTGALVILAGLTVSVAGRHCSA